MSDIQAPPCRPTEQAPVSAGQLPPSGGLSRRGALVDIVAGVIGGLLAFPLLGMLIGPLRRSTRGKWVKVGPADQFRGGARSEVEFTYVKQDAWLPTVAKRRVVVGEDAGAPAGFAVFSTTCTHLGCGVRWDESGRQFLCPCHGGVFDASGRPVRGPLSGPLARLQARVAEDGQLEVREA